MRLALALAVALVGCDWQTDNYRREHQCRDYCAIAGSDYYEALACIRCLNGKQPRVGGGAAASDD